MPYDKSFVQTFLISLLLSRGVQWTFSLHSAKKGRFSEIGIYQNLKFNVRAP